MLLFLHVVLMPAVSIATAAPKPGSSTRRRRSARPSRARPCSTPASFGLFLADDALHDRVDVALLDLHVQLERLGELLDRLAPACAGLGRVEGLQHLRDLTVVTLQDRHGIVHHVPPVGLVWSCVPCATRETSAGASERGVGVRGVRVARVESSPRVRRSASVSRALPRRRGRPGLAQLAGREASRARAGARRTPGRPSACSRDRLRPVRSTSFTDRPLLALRVRRIERARARRRSRRWRPTCGSPWP